MRKKPTSPHTPPPAIRLLEALGLIRRTWDPEVQDYLIWPTPELLSLPDGEGLAG